MPEPTHREASGERRLVGAGTMEHYCEHLSLNASNPSEGMRVRTGGPPTEGTQASCPFSLL